ncbi:hypothetical protein PAPHI01_1208 [Pancytospora philotis]|nr:hypothetical protein PAPHI01_1208 [Pancytospora philotis]
MESKDRVNSIQDCLNYSGCKSKLSCIRYTIMLKVIVTVLKMASTCAILYIKCDDRVKMSTKIFLGVYCVINTASTIRFVYNNRRFFQMHCFNEYEDNSNRLLINNCFKAIMFTWYIIGNFWIQEYDVYRVTNPLLYYPSSYWILFWLSLFIALLQVLGMLFAIVDFVELKLKAISYSLLRAIPMPKTSSSDSKHNKFN